MRDGTSFAGGATVIGEDGVVEGGEVLPRFALAVGEWFARVDRAEL